MQTHFTHEKLVSIIVCYKTDLKKFKDIIQAHISNFQHVIVVNNSPKIPLDSLSSPKISIIKNEGNLGLSLALNAGILKAKELGYKWVSLFDQDTLIPENFSQLMHKYINKHQGSKPVAVYSPVFHNHVIDESSKHISFKPFRLIRREPVSELDFAYPSYVITSGSIIPMGVLDDIGPMREELFIDFVDIEWCLRARAKGYDVVAINKVMIDHHLGDYAVQFMGHRYPIHSPLRMYYYFRNAMYLYRFREIDWNWRVVDSARNLFRFLFYMLFVKDRPTYFKYIIKGYYHGLIKKMGKLEE